MPEHRSDCLLDPIGATPTWSFVAPLGDNLWSAGGRACATGSHRPPRPPVGWGSIPKTKRTLPGRTVRWHGVRRRSLEHGMPCLFPLRSLPLLSCSAEWRPRKATRQVCFERSPGPQGRLTGCARRDRLHALRLDHFVSDFHSVST